MPMKLLADYFFIDFVTMHIIMIIIINVIMRGSKMTAQTARITILSTPDFKIWLTKEAEQEGISLSELVRRRCQAKPNKDEVLLSALVTEVQHATKKAKISLGKGLKDAKTVLAELRSAKK